jgi:hypothetical protein
VPAGEDTTTVDVAGGTTRTELGRRRRTAVLAGGVAAALAVGGLAAWAGLPPDQTAPKAMAAPGPVRVACTVQYALRSAVNGRSSSVVTIRNTGSTAVDTWRLSFTLPDQQRLLRGWSGRWEQSGRLVHALGGTLPPGGSVTTGFDAAYRNVTSLPTGFALNGTACASMMSVQGQDTPTAPAPTRSSPKPAKAAHGVATAHEEANGGDNAGKGKGKGKGGPGKD